jgi:hypothetical protein
MKQYSSKLASLLVAVSALSVASFFSQNGMQQQAFAVSETCTVTSTSCFCYDTSILSKDTMMLCFGNKDQCNKAQSTDTKASSECSKRILGYYISSFFKKD